MSARGIRMEVGGKPVGQGITWAYPAGPPDVHYRIPTYEMVVRGTTDLGQAQEERFEVFRFGVQQTPDQEPRSVGLANPQTHTIKAWLPHYSVHSAPSSEMGAWQVYDNFLVHDGPDDPRSAAAPYATIGCIELCGPRRFDALNDLLIRCSGLRQGTRAEKLAAIGRSKMLVIAYAAAVRPPVVRL